MRVVEVFVERQRLRQRFGLGLAEVFRAAQQVVALAVYLDVVMNVIDDLLVDGTELQSVERRIANPVLHRGLVSALEAALAQDEELGGAAQGQLSR